MGKKRRNKKTKQEKQSHEPDDNIPINTSSSSTSMNPNDFISNLPDNILHHITSYLPFESAVRTSFLSTHWKHLWKEALLDSVHDVTMEAAIKAIQSFLDGFDTHCRPRNKWGFIFEFSNGRNILAASISRNGTLRLDFSAGKQEFPMPFDLDLKPLQTQLPYSNTMKVKSLYLVSVSHLSNVAVSSLVPNLPFLESLTIAKCEGLQSLQIKEAKVLHKLVILDCPQLQSLSLKIDPKCYNMPSTGKFSTLFIVPDKLCDLKAIKLEGFADEEKEIFMARRLIPLFGDNNPVIISKSGGKCLKHLMKVAKLEKKGKYHYKFKVVDNVSENFPKHIHSSFQPLI
ncbi:hypothetical protein GOBAR_DD00742 [Gossypium barbadense]|nr:hypothetical protein GOBAR_DD00742 [Gossypium barbadense]